MQEIVLLDQSFVKGDSKTVPWNQQIDVLLIDGDHSYDGVRTDYERFEPHVKEGGLILLHDAMWGHKGVRKFFWDEIKYPKSVLHLSKSGMGLVSKMTPPYYNEGRIKLNHVG